MWRFLWKQHDLALLKNCSLEPETRTYDVWMENVLIRLFLLSFGWRSGDAQVLRKNCIFIRLDGYIRAVQRRQWIVWKWQVPSYAQNRYHVGSLLVTLPHHLERVLGLHKQLCVPCGFRITYLLWWRHLLTSQQLWLWTSFFCVELVAVFFLLEMVVVSPWCRNTAVIHCLSSFDRHVTHSQWLCVCSHATRC